MSALTRDLNASYESLRLRKLMILLLTILGAFIFAFYKVFYIKLRKVLSVFTVGELKSMYSEDAYIKESEIKAYLDLKL